MWTHSLRLRVETNSDVARQRFWQKYSRTTWRRARLLSKSDWLKPYIWDSCCNERCHWHLCVQHLHASSGRFNSWQILDAWVGHSDHTLYSHRDYDACSKITIDRLFHWEVEHDEMGPLHSVSSLQLHLDVQHLSQRVRKLVNESDWDHKLRELPAFRRNHTDSRQYSTSCAEGQLLVRWRRTSRKSIRCLHLWRACLLRHGKWRVLVT